jgi:hypothetical protein
MVSPLQRPSVASATSCSPHIALGCLRALLSLVRTDPVPARTSKHVLRYSALRRLPTGVRPNGAASMRHVTPCIEVNKNALHARKCQLFSNIARWDVINGSCLQEVGHIAHHQLHVTVPEVRPFCNYDLRVLPCVAITRTLKHFLCSFSLSDWQQPDFPRVGRSIFFCAPLGLHLLHANYLLRFWQFLQKLHSAVRVVSSLLPIHSPNARMPHSCLMSWLLAGSNQMFPSISRSFLILLGSNIYHSCGICFHSYL